MPRPNRRHRSKQIALGGVFASLALVAMLLGGLLPLASFSAPIFASLCLIPVAYEMGTKTALLAYVAVSILSALLVPNHEMILFFVILTGYYPQLQPIINKINNKAWRILPKILLFNLSVVVVYTLLLFLFASPGVRESITGKTWWLWVGVLLAGNITFVLYDFLIGWVRIVYVCRIRKKICK